MTYQSFNTDRLDEREKEIANVFAAMREARKKFADGKKAVGKGGKEVAVFQAASICSGSC